MQHALEPVRGELVGEVDERARRRRDRQPVDVVMSCRFVACWCGARGSPWSSSSDGRVITSILPLGHRHQVPRARRLRGSRAAPLRSAAGQHRRPQPRPRGQPRMPDRVHAAVIGVQPPAADAAARSRRARAPRRAAARSRSSRPGAPRPPKPGRWRTKRRSLGTNSSQRRPFPAHPPSMPQFPRPLLGHGLPQRHVHLFGRTRAETAPARPVGSPASRPASWRSAAARARPAARGPSPSVLACHSSTTGVPRTSSRTSAAAADLVDDGVGESRARRPRRRRPRRSPPRGC